jgi:hypothetical protein
MGRQGLDEPADEDHSEPRLNIGRAMIVSGSSHFLPTLAEVTTEFPDV